MPSYLAYLTDAVAVVWPPIPTPMCVPLLADDLAAWFATRFVQPRCPLHNPTGVRRLCRPPRRPPRTARPTPWGLSASRRNLTRCAGSWRRGSRPGCRSWRRTSSCTSRARALPRAVRPHVAGWRQGGGGACGGGGPHTCVPRLVPTLRGGCQVSGWEVRAVACGMLGGIGTHAMPVHCFRCS